MASVWPTAADILLSREGKLREETEGEREGREGGESVGTPLCWSRRSNRKIRELIPPQKKERERKGEGTEVRRGRSEGGGAYLVQRQVQESLCSLGKIGCIGCSYMIS